MASRQVFVHPSSAATLCTRCRGPLCKRLQPYASKAAAQHLAPLNGAARPGLFYFHGNAAKREYGYAFRQAALAQGAAALAT